jgi:SAM-dependent methyltransferase
MARHNRLRKKMQESCALPKSRRRESHYPSSLFVSKCAAKIAEAASGKPIVDVGCGSGRNAIPFLQMGCTVICMDKDLSCLRLRQRNTGQLITRQLDVLLDRWPFAPGSLGGIINVHLTLPPLLPHFARSLSRGAYLLMESVSAHGDNYLELPKQGELKTTLARWFDLEMYRERKAGPRGCDAVTVQLLAKRKN